MRKLSGGYELWSPIRCLDAKKMTFPLNEIYMAFGDGKRDCCGSRIRPCSLIPERVIATSQKGIIGRCAERSLATTSDKCDQPVFFRAWMESHFVVRFCVSYPKSRSNIFWGTFREAEIRRDEGQSSPFPRLPYPKRFRLKGKKGFADVTHKVDEKWLTLWAYFRIAALFRSGGHRSTV